MALNKKYTMSGHRNSTIPVHLDACVHQAFEMQAVRTPDACAVIFKDKSITYGQLNQRANQLAWNLINLGVGPDVAVGICGERSIEFIVGLLGVLKAGGICFPLDPKYPMHRLAYMLQDGDARVVLVDGQVRQRLPECQAKIILLNEVPETSFSSSNPPSGRPTPENLAYLIYTSGSTGQPKGVEITHRGIVQLLTNTNYVNLDETKSVLQLSALTFDGSIFEIWGALLSGARCVLYPGRVPLIGEIGDLILKHRITTASLTPTLFNAIVDENPTVLATLQQLILGGEAPSVSHIRRAWADLKNVQIINCYGPTEATIDACSFVIAAKPDEFVTSIPIGRPIGDTYAYVLGPNLQMVRLGATGELFLGGERLARGYRNRADLTAQRFIPDPFNKFSDARLFKTGDLARFTRDGNIEFLGRMDDQVKVRGFRIELGEVEASLRRHEGVRDVVVLPYKDLRGDKRISAFVLRRPNFQFSVDELLGFLRVSLPEFMVPSRCCVLDRWPLTSTGKVDRQALEKIGVVIPAFASAIVQPRTDLEKELVQIFEQILDVRPIGIQDSFFDLGGDSLHAVLLLAQIEKVFGKRLPVAAILGVGTIEQLADLLQEVESLDRLAYAVPVQPAGEKPIFFCVGAGFKMNPLIFQLGTDQPFYSVGLKPECVDKFKWPFQMEELARHLVSVIREKQPEGPYYLGGFCADGLFAYEIASQLTAQGQSVGLLVLFETENLCRIAKARIAIGMRRMVIRLHFRVNQLLRGGLSEISVYARSRWAEFKQLLARITWRVSVHFQFAKHQIHPADMDRILFLAASAYKPKALGCPTVIFRCKDWPIAAAGDPYLGWGGLLTGRCETFEVPGDHFGIFSESNAKLLSDKLRECLWDANQPEGSTSQITGNGAPTFFAIDKALR